MKNLYNLTGLLFLSLAFFVGCEKNNEIVCYTEKDILIPTQSYKSGRELGLMIPIHFFTNTGAEVTAQTVFCKNIN